MKEIRLKHGEIALVDDQDYQLVAGYKWRLHPLGYAATSVRENGKNQTLLMHRVILGSKKGELTDHWDQDRLNNQRYNIRIATQRQNQGNAWWPKEGKTSKYKGVFWYTKLGRWVAALKVTANGKKRSVYLGSFTHETDAAKAYNAAAIKHFGPEFAMTNAV